MPNALTYEIAGYRRPNALMDFLAFLFPQLSTKNVEETEGNALTRPADKPPRVGGTRK